MNTSHTIKVARGYARAKIGRYSLTRQAMLSYVPASILDRVTGKELGELLDALYAATERAKAISARDAINEGCIWDAHNSKMREIA